MRKVVSRGGFQLAGTKIPTILCAYFMAHTHSHTANYMHIVNEASVLSANQMPDVH